METFTPAAFSDAERKFYTMKKYRQIGILTLLLWILLPLVLHAAPVGKVTAIEGEVDLAASGKEARPVTPGDPVNVGDFIRTKSRSKCEVTFIDGNILRLAESTRIQVSEYMIENDRRRETIGLLRGKIRSIVQKGIHALGTERGGHYEVRTPTAVLGVRGSDVINYYLNGIAGGVIIAGNGYGYPLGAPQFIQNYGPGQMLMIIGINLPPILQSVNQQQIDQHIYDTNLGSGSGGATTTTAPTTTGTTAITTAATTVPPSGPPSGLTTAITTTGTTTSTTVVNGNWTGNPHARELLPAAFVEPSTTMAPTTSIMPMTTVLATTTVRPTTTTTTVATTTSTTTAQSTTTTTVLPTTTTVATTTTSSSSSTSSTSSSTSSTSSSTSSSTTSTSTTSTTTTTTVPPGAEPISGNITGLFANPVAATGHVYSTGAAGSVSVNGTDTVPANPWPIASFAGTYGTGSGTFDGYFTGYTGSWDGLFHAIYFTGGNAGYFRGGMGATGNVFTGSGPTYGATTVGASVGTTLTAWTYPLPRFGDITIVDGSLAFGPTGGTYNSGVKGVDLVSGQKMGVWGTTNTGSTFTTDGSSSWSGVFFQGDSNYQMVGRIYGSTSTPFWSIGTSGTGDPSTLYYLDGTHLGTLILNYRAKGVGGAYALAGAGSFFLDPLVFASALNAPAITGPQNLDTTGRMGVIISEATYRANFLGKSALDDQSVWMNAISDPARFTRGTFVGFKQTGTSSEGGDFSYQGTMYGLYEDDATLGFLKTLAKSDYDNDAFRMKGTLERNLIGSGVNTFDSPQNIAGGGSQYSTGQFNRFTGENWGVFSSYLAGTTWPAGNTPEANNGNLFHRLNLDTGGATPPGAPPGSPSGSRIGEMPVPGAWMNISEAITGVSGGQLYSQGPASGWQAVAAGGWLETNRYNAMRGTSGGQTILDMLNIPRSSIGSVALSGSNSNTNVSMTAYFYGYSSGPPRIFISDNVAGTTLVNPNGTTLTLSGTGFTANVNFTFTNWNTSTNKWAATVNTTSAGQINPSVGPWTHMRGYSAGAFITSASTSFSGTAAGVAVPP
jgi:hypothetical protein